MKPLIVLLVAALLSLITIRLFTGRLDVQLAGRIAMSCMFVFTAIGHFVYTRGMEMMIPAIVPARGALVILTGVFEIAAAAGLLVQSTSRTTGWVVILFFVFILPANVYAAVRGVDYQKGTLDGPGRPYLWFRVPLQLFFHRLGVLLFCPTAVS